ncbi:heparinase II/III family protein [bacterium]|nr:heparinase II/III family protein [bacterium]
MSLPPIRRDHPRLGFAPGAVRAKVEKFARNPLWPPLRERAKGGLATESDDPVTLINALHFGGLLALAEGDSQVVQRCNALWGRLNGAVEAGAYRVSDDLHNAFQMVALAFAYDWCAPSMGPELRRRSAGTLVRLADYTLKTFPGYFAEGRYAAFNNHAIWNHAGLGLVGFAAYGDHPDAVRHAAYSWDQFHRVVFPIFDRFVGAEGIWNEGTHYNHVADRPTFLWMEGAGTATGQDLFDRPWVRATPFFWVYLTRADGTMTILGDWFAGHDPVDVFNQLARSFWSVAKAAQETQDPHLQAFAAWEMARAREIGQGGQHSPLNALWFDPDLPERPFAELPPSRLFRGSADVGGGETLAVLRSGWGDDARLITFSMGDWLGHHDHYDANSFTVYYKGDLVVDPGYGGEGDISWRFYRRTSAHSSILVDAPEAEAAEADVVQRGWGFDGGQRVPLVKDRPRNVEQFFEVKNPEYPESSLFETGDCLAFETHGDYDYVVGDAAKAYHRAQLTRFVRHLVYLKPDALIIYDVVETPPGRVPRWVMQCDREPVVTGGRVVVTHGGQARAQTLLPAAAPVRVEQTPGRVSGREANAGKAGAGFRVEVSGGPGTEHRFLHVLQITDPEDREDVQASWRREEERLCVLVRQAGRTREVRLKWDGEVGAVVSVER